MQISPHSSPIQPLAPQSRSASAGVRSVAEPAKVPDSGRASANSIPSQGRDQLLAELAVTRAPRGIRRLELDSNASSGDTNRALAAYRETRVVSEREYIPDLNRIDLFG